MTSRLVSVSARFSSFSAMPLRNAVWRPAGHDLVEGLPGPVGKLRGYTLSGQRDVVRRARANNHRCHCRVAEPERGGRLRKRCAEVLAYAG